MAIARIASLGSGFRVLQADSDDRIGHFGHVP